LQVVVLVLEPVEPLDLVIRGEMRLTVMRQRQEVVGVPPMGRRLVT
jgi:hypothetical protein